MKRSSRGMFIKIIALLAAGAALNVAVAWGLVFLLDTFPDELPPTQHATWPGPVPKHWSVEADVSVWSNWPIREITAFGYADVVGSYHAMACQYVLEAGFPCQTLNRMVCQEELAGDSLGRPDQQTPSNWREGLPWPDRLAWMDRQSRRVVPIRPLWPGFAFNTLFYSGVLWMLFCGRPFALRRMIRRRRGRCPACNYPIGQSPVCTECGAAVTPKPIRGRCQLADTELP